MFVGSESFWGWFKSMFYLLQYGYTHPVTMVDTPNLEPHNQQSRH